MEVEFVAKTDEVLPDGKSNILYDDFVAAVSIRVARDLIALLPVKMVIVHVVEDRNR